MLYESNNELTDLDSTPTRAAPVGGAFPSEVVLSERAAGALRTYLENNGLGDYRIFYCGYHDLNDLDNYVSALDATAAWEPHAPAVAGGEPITLLTYDTNAARLWPGGILRLESFDLVVARWYWMDVNQAATALFLLAAPSAEHYFRLHRKVESLRHDRAAAVWQVVRGSSYNDGERIPRNLKAGDDLLLPAEIRTRIDVDVIHFFDTEVASLYADMGVPYRRGVLLHGPPGNGKTSTIRYIGAALPHIPAMILRPAAGFDSDDLEEVLKHWRRQAPAILVIEDLNWLMEQVNVSTFLNLLDGVESNVTGGLLLIATTNHPDKLDPALNNRPGRFDVVIDVPCPDLAVRTEFFRRKLPGLDRPLLDKLSAATDRLSFAHLQEIVRLSGLLAIYAGRRERSDDDLLGAARTVGACHQEAFNGFPAKTETPFGLAAWHSRA